MYMLCLSTTIINIHVELVEMTVVIVKSLFVDCFNVDSQQY